MDKVERGRDDLIRSQTRQYCEPKQKVLLSKELLSLVVWYNHTKCRFELSTMWAYSGYSDRLKDKLVKEVHIRFRQNF